MKQAIEEYNWVKNSVGLFDFSMEAKLKVGGLGRVGFVDGLVSNDVKNLAENNGIYATFLDKFGKILSDCIIYKFGKFLLINLNVIGKNSILKKLGEEATLGKSEIEDLTLRYGLFSLQGPKSLKVLSNIINDNLELKNQYQCAIKKITIDNNKKLNNGLIDNKNKFNLKNNKIELIIAKNKRTTEEGYDIFVPASHYKELKDLILKKGKNSEIKTINNDTYNILRLEAGIPLFSIDFTEKNIINEVTEKAVSYEKGCFVGQEIVARVKNIGRGLTPKKLFYFEIDSLEVPEKNAKIMKDDKEAGFITSAAFSPCKNKVVALGFLLKEFYGKDITVNNSKTTIKPV